MAEDAFAEKAKAWDGSQAQWRMADEFAAKLDSLVAFTPRTVALDFGCGTGLVGLRFASRVRTLFMLDTSPAMLAVLREKLADGGYDNVRVSSSPLLEAVGVPGTLDVIFTSMALHHVADLPELFAAMREALKPGGQLVAGELLPEDGSFHGQGIVPHNGLDPEELARLLHAAGFSERRRYDNGVVAKPGKDGVTREYGKFVLAARKP